MNGVGGAGGHGRGRRRLGPRQVDSGRVATTDAATGHAWGAPRGRRRCSGGGAAAAAAGCRPPRLATGGVMRRPAGARERKTRGGRAPVRPRATRRPVDDTTGGRGGGRRHRIVGGAWRAAARPRAARWRAPAQASGVRNPTQRRWSWDALSACQKDFLWEAGSTLVLDHRACMQKRCALWALPPSRRAESSRRRGGRWAPRWAPRRPPRAAVGGGHPAAGIAGAALGGHLGVSMGAGTASPQSWAWRRALGRAQRAYTCRVAGDREGRGVQPPVGWRWAGGAARRRGACSHASPPRRCGRLCAPVACVWGAF